MKKQIERIKDHYIVCGFGDIGSTICSALSEDDIPFVVIEANAETAEYAMQRRFLVVQGKATYDTSLLQAGIQRASGIVICLGDDSANMHVSLAARELNPDVFIVTRAYKAHVEKRMIRAGANSVVNPLKVGGEQFANLITRQFRGDEDFDENYLSRSTVMGYGLKMYQHFRVEPTTIEAVVQKLGASLALKLRKHDGVEITDPQPDAIVQPHETVLLLVIEKDSADSEEEAAERFSLFKWSDEYAIGNEEIDKQHQQVANRGQQGAWQSSPWEWFERRP